MSALARFIAAGLAQGFSFFATPLSLAIGGAFPGADAFMPCGGCRQVLVEAERRQGQPLRVILQVRDEDVMISESAVNLMPFAFEAHGLGGQES